MAQGILSRRHLLAASGGGLALAGCGGQARDAAAQPDPGWRATRGRIRQSVVAWCFKPMELDELAAGAAAMGLRSVELVPPKDWDILRRHGLICAITPSHGFAVGLNRREHHPTCIAKLNDAIDATAAASWPAVITFSGMRAGISDEEGIANMVDGLKQIAARAERGRVDICIEVLNSRVAENMKGHPDYHADRVEFAVEVCKRVGSPRVKILFDIYHVQIMQGDVIARIRANASWIGHYHTAGVPGRGEIDDTQELNYGAIMRAIAETGYAGFVGQEFIPARADKLASLRQAAAICDV